MVSGWYMEQITEAPIMEWRRPTAGQYKRMSPAMKEHIDRGGLDLYPIEHKLSESKANGV